MVRWEYTEQNHAFSEDADENLYSSASIQVFCEGESCGMGNKTMHFDFSDELDWDFPGFSYEDLTSHINEAVQKLQVGGKYHCDTCKGVDRLVSRDEEDNNLEAGANLLHESFCENCGNMVDVVKSMGAHTQYLCDACGYTPSLDSEGGWETDESAESQEYGEVFTCRYCHNEFISKDFVKNSMICRSCVIQEIEDDEDSDDEYW